MPIAPRPRGCGVRHARWSRDSRVALAVPTTIGVFSSSFGAQRGQVDDRFDYPSAPHPSHDFLAVANASDPGADAHALDPACPPDLMRFWLTGGAAIGAADSSEVHLLVSLGATRYVAPRLALGVGGMLAREYSDSGFWSGSSLVRTVRAVDACSEYVVWRGRSTRALATADRGVGWLLEARGPFATTPQGDRGVHGAVGVAVVHRPLANRWGVVFHVAYHPEMGQDLWKPFFTISLGANRQRWQERGD